MDEQLVNDLKEYLSDDAETDGMISLSVKRAIRSFKKKRSYPSGYTEEKINADMEYCYDCIFDLALYFLLKQGAEFQESHSENSVSRNWESETEIYINHGVFPFAGSLI